MVRAITRRRWLAAAAGGRTLPTLIPSAALGLDGTVAPSSRVVLGCIGVGNQGMGNLRTFRGNDEVRIAAVCDVYESQRLRAKQAVDEFYGNQDCAAYRDFRELLAQKDIDAVQITTPDHWHPLIAMEAVRQGKHIYCEKPIG